MKKRVSIIICLILMCLVPFSACNESSAPPQNDTDSIISGDHENNTEIGGECNDNGNSADVEDKDDNNSSNDNSTEDTDAETTPPPATDDSQKEDSDISTNVTPPSDTQNPTPPPADTENSTDSETSPDSDKQGNIKIISLTSPIKPNNTATIEIQGLPSTEYVIKVYYSSGASTAKGLENKTSDENGVVSWSWKVGGRTKAGRYRIVIQGGEEKFETYFEVAE